MTGCGADSQNVAGVASCNSYETANGVTASTTGNITGVYDTSGGAWDYVAGVMYTENGTDLAIASSGFEQAELNQIGQTGKYIDVYEYGMDGQDRSRGHLGDATIEMGTLHSDLSDWYDDYASFLFQSCAWFVRGAYWKNDPYGMGPIAFACGSGVLSPIYGSRVVVV